MATREYRIKVKIDSSGAKTGADDVGRNLDSIGKKSSAASLSVKAMGAAVAALGGLVTVAAVKRLAGSFLEAASEAENYRVRLKVLLGDVEEGNRLFQNMADYAGRVPFEYREVMGAATNLSAVLKGGVDEVTAWMPLIGDVAAASGLTLQQTTEQVVRMLSAGAGAADLFRERGILAMLGFESGVKYSLEETRQKLITAWEEPTSKFRGATDDLAQTWTGTMSMLSDAWFKFRTNVMDQGLHESLTEIVADLVTLASNESIQKFAVDVGSALATVVRNLSVLQSAVLNTVASMNEAAASASGAILAIDKFLTRGQGPQIAGREQHIAELRALAAAQRQAADEALGFAKADSALASQFKSSIQNFGAGAVSLRDFAGAAGSAGEMSEKAAQKIKDKLRREIDALNKSLKTMKENMKEADDAYRDFVDQGIGMERTDRSVAGIIAGETNIFGQTQAEVAAILAGMDFIDEKLQAIIIRKGKILETMQDWQGAAYIIADALYDVDKALANVVGSAGDFLGALQQIGQEGGKINAWVAGLDLARSIGSAVMGPNTYAAEGSAAGALVGALVGAYFTQSAAGAQAGAAIGASAGGALGSFVKKGVDEFLGHIQAAEGYAVSQMDSARNSISQVGKQFADAIARGINDAIDALGGELLSLPQLEIKIRDGIYSVFSNGIIARFNSMQEAVDFAILQALREGQITGLSDEVMAALRNSTAESFQAMAADLDFARWVQFLPEIGEAASESGIILERAVDDYASALRKARQLGIDTAKIDQDFARGVTGLRNSILGIVETNEERIRREAEAFNRELALFKAKQLILESELAAEQVALKAKEASVRAELKLLEAQVDIWKWTISVEGEMVAAEADILAAKIALLDETLAALAAVESALGSVRTILDTLPGLISEADIQDAINRSRGGGGKQRAEAREELRAEVLLFGLSDIESALADAGKFASDFAERIKGMGFSAEEAAQLMALAQEEQSRLIEEVRNGIRQSYYDVIAAAQGLTEVWRVLDLFRDLRQEILDAGLSAEETARRLKGLDWAEGIEKQKIEFGIVDKLFGYLSESEAFAAQSVEFARMKVDLEFGIMKAQLQLLGVFDKYVEIFDAALAAALAAVDRVPDMVPPTVQVRNNFNDAARDAARIRESFARAKLDVAEFLNEMLRGEHGGVSPVGGVVEAERQFAEVLRQAKTGNIGAMESFDDYGSSLLSLARDAYGSSPEFQAIYDYVLASGRDVLKVKQGREGNVVFDERFYSGQQAQISEQQAMNALLAKIERHLARGGGPIAGAGVNP